MDDAERSEWVRQLGIKAKEAERLGATVTGARWENGRLSVIMVVPPKTKRQPVEEPAPEPKVSRGMSRLVPPNPPQGSLL